MAAEVSWMLELNVLPGREEAFRVLMNEMVAATHANETGTLNYEWSTSPDGHVCHIFERYADSAAVLTHLATFGEKFAGRFLDILRPARMVVYGSPSQEVKDALAGFKAHYMQPVGGFSRQGWEEKD
ncbi:MAG: antibiotic biosynthesis monooxygenase [Acidobacteria bacterium]|nr:antibiotic biosynthesis monooxygenase [Acidobacteriota bacterium]